jgi:hypothetical protein
MATLLGGQKQSPEELEKTRQVRTDYQNTLSQLQTNVNADVNSKKLTPESGQAILELLKTSQDWLSKNPNASISEVLSNQDTTVTEVKRIQGIDKPKREFINMVSALPAISNDLQQKKKIDSTQQAKLNALAIEENKWFGKNGSDATEIEFSQETLKLKDTITTIVPDNDIRNYIMAELDKAKQMAPDELAGNLNSAEKSLKRRKGQQVSVGEGISVIWKTAMSVFFSLLVISLCIMAGSFAANMAIGRDPPYRILYFLYGALPTFAPFVLLYGIYKRLRYGPFTIYSILPVSIEPATTRLGKIFWFPFYWIPDEKAVAEYDLYRKAVEAAIPA